MHIKTNSRQFLELGTELTPEQLEQVSGGMPYRLGPRDLGRFFAGAGKVVGQAVSDVGHAVGHAASELGNAVVSAGKSVVDFFGGLF